jgi:hypothetical protein
MRYTLEHSITAYVSFAQVTRGSNDDTADFFRNKTYRHRFGARRSATLGKLEQTGFQLMSTGCCAQTPVNLILHPRGPSAFAVVTRWTSWAATATERASQAASHAIKGEKTSILRRGCSRSDDWRLGSAWFRPKAASRHADPSWNGTLPSSWRPASVPCFRVRQGGAWGWLGLVWMFIYIGV